MSGVNSSVTVPLGACSSSLIHWDSAINLEETRAESAARVVVISDVRLFRDALENSLKSQSIVVLSTSQLNSAVAAVNNLKPDAVVLDATGPGALAAARAFKNILPDLVIIAVLSIQSEADFLAWAELGVRGFADQHSSANDLALSVEHALRGEVHCSPRLTALLASQLARLSVERRVDKVLDVLTPREHRVLELLAEGLSNKRIALSLGISATTTKNHVHNILAKLGLRSRAQAAVLCFRVRGDTGA